MEQNEDYFIKIEAEVITDGMINAFKVIANVDLEKTGVGLATNILIAEMFLSCQGFSIRDITYTNFKLFIITNTEHQNKLCDIDRTLVDECIAYRFTAQKVDAFRKLIGNNLVHDNNTPKILQCPVIIPVYSSNMSLPMYDFGPIPLDSTQESLKLWSENIKKFKAEFQFEHEFNNNIKYELWLKLIIKKK